MKIRVVCKDKEYPLYVMQRKLFGLFWVDAYVSNGRGKPSKRCASGISPEKAVDVWISRNKESGVIIEETTLAKFMDSRMMPVSSIKIDK